MTECEAERQFASPGGGAPSTLRKRALVVDDNSDNRKLLVWILEDAGLESVQCVSAEEALARLEHEEFSIVLMDISLPGMQGDNAIRTIRQNKRFDNLPVFAVTAHAIHSEAQRILASGATEIVTKPVDEDLFLATIEKYLGG